ncbi:hypothetical protein [Saccharothrix variisporea]|uniref:Uncharacterized protein n=1 Tax=Saccharothrix variisporea TaxID=543527 RepID=A0A495X6V7_9PSEU|nr:hypothetical protein [Saccharothrix variisporea]RKT69637.1 hypothetical protein DFJ66_2871 [Saccharothrix variisporea]
MLTRFLRWHPPLMLFSLLMGALALASAVGLVVDDRILVGSPIWFKPFKFGISLALYGVALAWMLTQATRLKKLGWWAGTVLALGGTAEMVIIVGQVLRGRRSHFNVATDFDATLWVVMAGTILVVWVMHAIIALVLAFSRFTNRPAGLAIRLGLGIALVGLALGQLMAGQDSGIEGIAGAHSVGVPDGGPYMPVTGWSTAGGDLRIPHFVGIHALQALPLLVVLLGRRANTRVVWVAAASYLGLTALTTWQALRGQPLLRPDSATWTAFLLLVTATVLAGAWALRTKPSTTPSTPPRTTETETEEPVAA